MGGLVRLRILRVRASLWLIAGALLLVQYTIISEPCCCFPGEFDDSGGLYRW